MLAAWRLHQHDELVAAEATDGISLADRAGEPLSHDLQKPVSGCVTEVVVDVLEPVDVYEQGAGEPALAARSASQQLRGAIEYQRPVGQARQVVVQSLMQELAGLLVHQRQRSPA